MNCTYCKLVEHVWKKGNLSTKSLQRPRLHLIWKTYVIRAYVKGLILVCPCKQIFIYQQPTPPFMVNSPRQSHSPFQLSLQHKEKVRQLFTSLLLLWFKKNNFVLIDLLEAINWKSWWTLFQWKFRPWLGSQVELPCSYSHKPLSVVLLRLIL